MVEDKGKSKRENKPTRLVLTCADDFGRLRCFLCQKIYTKESKLYDHMLDHSKSDWRKVLPKELSNCISVVVCHTYASLDDYYDEESSDDVEEECLTRREGEVDDLMKFLPAWKVSGKGKVKDKRGRPSCIKHVVLPRSKKLKSMVDNEEKGKAVVEDVEEEDEGLLEAARLLASKFKRDEAVVPEGVKSKADVAKGGGGKVVFDFDLNVAATEDEE